MIKKEEKNETEIKVCNLVVFSNQSVRTAISERNGKGKQKKKWTNIQIS